MKDNLLKKFLLRIDSSADTHSKGWSARKLTAFTMTMLIVVVVLIWLRYAYNNGKFELLLEVLVMLSSIIAACLGMTTFQAMQKTKDESKKDTDSGDSTPAPL